MLNVLIPMAGRGQRFAAAGYKEPKPFIDVGGAPMIERVIQNVRPREQRSRVICLTRREHLERARHSVAQFDGECLPVNEVTGGAACTALLAIEHINTDEPLLIANADQLVDVAIDHFIPQVESYDGGIMTFPATDPKWSFVRCDAARCVMEVAEKIPLSDEATVGIYYWAHGRDFVAAAQQMITREILVNGEYYIAPTYNEMILRGHRVRAWKIAAEQMHGLGTPSDLQAYLRQRASQ